MKFEIVTLFPDYFSLSLRQSLLGKAADKQLFDIGIYNPRDFARDKHHTVDDTPYGGGGGMVMKIDPIDLCLQSIGWERKAELNAPREKEVLLLTSASGKRFDQSLAVRYSLMDRVTIVCGHYLGIDERLSELYDLEEVSIGDYVLTGGEPAAVVMIDAIARLIPKVLGNFESALGDSYMNQMLGSPCYTRPAEYEGIEVPEVLQSGDHSRIKEYRRAEAIRRCHYSRRELLDDADLSPVEVALVKRLDDEINDRDRKD